MDARRLVLDPAHGAGSWAVTPMPAKRPKRRPSGTSTTTCPPAPKPPPRTGPVPVGSATRPRAPPRAALGAAVGDAPAALELERPEAPTLGAFQEKGSPAVVRPSTRKASRTKRGPLAVRHVGQPMPGVDEPVERAAAAAEGRDAQAEVQVRAEAAPERQVQDRRLAVEQEAPVLGVLARLVLRPGERVRPQHGRADLESTGGHRPRRERGQREPGLGQQLPVADLGGAAGAPSGARRESQWPPRWTRRSGGRRGRSSGDLGDGQLGTPGEISILVRVSDGRTSRRGEEAKCSTFRGMLPGRQR